MMRDLGKLGSLPGAERNEILLAVRRIPVFAQLEESAIACLEHAELMQGEPGDAVLEQGKMTDAFWILLEGEVRVETLGPEGERRTMVVHRGSETFGELPLLAGSPNRTGCVIGHPSRLLRLEEDQFWQLMTSCPKVRKGILANMALRLEGLQVLVMQREKLALLGTMAAGLMHELNNPGSAAKRAAGQLRETLWRLQSLNLQACRKGWNASEADCAERLEKHVFAPSKRAAMSSMEQADAEEAMTDWLEQAGVKDAWRLAPGLVGAGFSAESLECVLSSFRAERMPEAVEWLETLVAAVDQVGTIEESITRVTELVSAVKRYSYADKSCTQAVDIQESLQSTLIILGHKIRQKEIHVAKQFTPELPKLTYNAGGLSQVWTNLIDNAIDAVAQGGHLTVRTWTEAGDVYAGICDDGPGIPPESQARIFEPFFTSKPMGVGTGLGLSIAMKIVVNNFRGEIRFTSEPGRTEFIVRLPIEQPDLQCKM